MLFKNWTCDKIFFKNGFVFNEKKLTTLLSTSPLQVQQVYIRNNINNNGISQQNPR